MVIDLTVEDSEEESPTRRTKMPRLLSNGSKVDDESSDNLLSDFLASVRKKRDHEDSNDRNDRNDCKIQVVVPSSRSVSELRAPSVETKSSVSISARKPSVHAHDELPSFYKVDDGEERVKKASYEKSKSVKHKPHLPIGRPFSENAAPFKGSPVRRCLVQKQIDALYAEKLEAIKGPPVELDIGSQKLSIDSNFQFINEYKLGDDLLRVDPSFNVPCNCGDACRFETCECVAAESDNPEDDASAPRKLIVQYVPGPKGLRVLDPSFLKREAPVIYECSSRCECPDTCFNRVVQHGRTIRLQIFNTPGQTRGFGLRSPDPIYAGQFIDFYLGEVISDEEADMREKANASKGKNNASYLFSLDFFNNWDKDGYPDYRMNVVDGKKFGSVTRFMNHSCKPNCKMIPATQNHADGYLYDLAFFALHDIPPMTELTFDYAPSWNKFSEEIDPVYDSDDDSDDDSDGAEAVPCLCGESNCRGKLWPNNRKANKMKSMKDRGKKKQKKQKKQNIRKKNHFNKKMARKHQYSIVDSSDE